MTDQRHKEAKKVTLVGFVLNLILTVFKFAAGVLGNSSAMIADAVHSVSDFATDLVVLTSLKISTKPNDHNHHYGHGKIETLAAALIGGVLLLVGVWLIYSSAMAINEHFTVEPLQEPGLVALFAAVFSVAIKEVLFRHTINVGNRINSKVIVANAWHHRSDSFSSLGTIIGIGGAILLGTHWVILDPIAALVVSFFILKVALRILKETLLELTEISLPSETQSEILNLAGSVKGIHQPHSLKTRHIGNNIAVEMHVFVDPTINVLQAHDLTLEVERKLFDRFGSTTHISIHVEPLEKCQNRSEEFGVKI